MQGRESRHDNLAHHLLGRADGADDDDVALVSGTGETFSRSQLRTAAAGLVDAFADDGLTGTRVGLDLSPTFSGVAAYIALLLNGNTVVVARRVEQPPWPTYLASAAIDGLIRAKGEGLAATVFGQERDYEVNAGWDGQRSDLPLPVIASDLPAINLFTSGTTGRPKMVEITHQALVDSTDAILDILPLDRSTRTALILSLAHSFGLSVLNTHLRAGSSLHCVERPEFTGDVLRALTVGGCTSLAGVPTQLRAVTAALGRSPDLEAQVDLVMQAGGRLETGDAEALLGVMKPGCRLYQMFGQTEAAARISILDAADRVRVPASVGRPIRGLTVRIVDEADQDVPAGEEGEVIVRGATLMRGYFDDPQATAEALREGWLYTGDFGHLDDEGFLYVTGRRSNFVKIDGERISLEAVEYAAISQADEVVDALASPVQKDDALEVRLSLVLEAPLDDGGWDDLQKRVRAAVRTGLGKKAMPTEIDVVEQVPYTPNGKKMRPRVTY